MSNSSSPSGNSSTRRSRAANKIISFAGLGGNKSSGSATTSINSGSTFPTFRFSPENEEIQEVLSSSVTYLPPADGGSSGGSDQSSSVANGVQPLSESLPSSPKPGDTSPIKEYIRKNWTNKWDKKSLSLDLDLRGKIKTAIEDKRKSIVSHFIPEEGAPIPLPTTIREHAGEESTSSGNYDPRIFTYDPSTQSITSNLTQNVNSSKGTTSTRRGEHDYEEIGVDFLASLEQESSLVDQLSADGVDASLLSWTYPPSALEEKFEGVLTTYESVSPINAVEVTDPEPLPVTQLCRDFCFKLLEHNLTKFCLGLLAASILLPVYSIFTAIFAFFAGILCTIIVSQTFSEIMVTSDTSSSSSAGEVEGHEELPRAPTPPQPTTNSDTGGAKILQLSPKSQGWMLKFDGIYNPHVITFHSTDSVFVRLDASLLYISSPSAKSYRIPKRKLWSDPPFTHDLKFVRHRIFDLTGAQIFIAPDRLASRRVWNKKYPIGIRLATPSHSWQVTRYHDPTSSVPSPSESIPETSHGSSKDKDKESTGTPSHTPFSKRRLSSGFVKSDKEFQRKPSDGKVLYLFSRTCREKEDWFRRLINATKMDATEATTAPAANGSLDLQQDYFRYMENILPNFDSVLRESKEEQNGKNSTKLKSSTSVESEDSVGNSDGITSLRSTPTHDLLEIESLLTLPQSPTFFNALLGRLLYDALHSAYWSLQLQNTIQRKLNFVKRPPFVELLIAKDVDLGGSFPMIQRASSPVIDSRGLWIDLDVTYEGNFCITLETKINLLKLRRSPAGDDNGDTATGTTEGNESVLDETANVRVGNLYDSDAEDSGESSEEEFDPEAFLKNTEEDFEFELGSGGQGSGSEPAGATQPSKRVKLLKMVEKVATSNFVSEMKMVKSAIDKVANTAICLTVEVKEMTGTISVNIPPPPTNRVWMGFRTKPEIKLVTTPRVGERQVNLNPLTDWIQRKIHQQIQRSIVLPNMDDVTIKVMEFKLPS